MILEDTKRSNYGCVQLGPRVKCLRPLYEAIEERAAQLAQQYENRDNNGPPAIVQIPTGVQALDDYGLLTPGILTLFVMHPGDGKTSVVLQLLKGAVSCGYTPRAWLFEDPLPLVADRYLSQELNESAYLLRTLKLGENMPSRLSAATRELDWTKQVLVEDLKEDSERFFEQLETAGDDAGLGVVDYAQAFDAEPDGANQERVIARAAWGISNWSKRTGNASVLMSQPKPAVADRGRKHYDSWLWDKKRKGEEIKPDPEAVEGYRPGDGDAGGCTAAYQRAKDFISGFRPGRWLNNHGLTCQDNVMEFLRTKGNYTPGNYAVRVKWNGATTTISDIPKKNK